MTETQISTAVHCHHGYVMQQDSCPGCDAMTEQQHAEVMVTVRSIVSGRPVKRCLMCDQPASHKAHRVTKIRKARKARNTNRQGANFELQVMADLKPHGYDCLRSSGSRGTVDVMAVAPADWRPVDENDSSNLIFIQCKITDPVISPADRAALIDLASRAAALPVVAHRVNGAVNYRQLIGPGPKDWRYWFPVWCTCGSPACNAKKEN